MPLTCTYFYYRLLSFTFVCTRRYFKMAHLSRQKRGGPDLGAGKRSSRSRRSGLGTAVGVASVGLFVPALGIADMLVLVEHIRRHEPPQTRSVVTFSGVVEAGFRVAFFDGEVYSTVYQKTLVQCPRKITMDISTAPRATNPRLLGIVTTRPQLSPCSGTRRCRIQAIRSVRSKAGSVNSKKGVTCSSPLW